MTCVDKTTYLSRDSMEVREVQDDLHFSQNHMKYSHTRSNKNDVLVR